LPRKFYHDHYCRNGTELNWVKAKVKENIPELGGFGFSSTLTLQRYFCGTRYENRAVSPIMGETKPGSGAVTLYLFKNEVLILTGKMSRISHTFPSVSYADSQKYLCLTAFFANKFDLAPYHF
jgi:hypothetical protein